MLWTGDEKISEKAKLHRVFYICVEFRNMDVLACFLTNIIGRYLTVAINDTLMNICACISVFTNPRVPVS